MHNLIAQHSKTTSPRRSPSRIHKNTTGLSHHDSRCSLEDIVSSIPTHQRKVFIQACATTEISTLIQQLTENDQWLIITSAPKSSTTSNHIAVPREICCPTSQKKTPSTNTRLSNVNAITAKLLDALLNELDTKLNKIKEPKQVEETNKAKNIETNEKKRIDCFNGNKSLAYLIGILSCNIIVLNPSALPDVLEILRKVKRIGIELMKKMLSDLGEMLDTAEDESQQLSMQVLKNYKPYCRQNMSKLSHPDLIKSIHSCRDKCKRIHAGLVLGVRAYFIDHTAIDTAQLSINQTFILQQPLQIAIQSPSQKQSTSSSCDSPSSRSVGTPSSVGKRKRIDLLENHEGDCSPHQKRYLASPTADGSIVNTPLTGRKDSPMSRCRFGQSKQQLFPPDVYDTGIDFSESDDEDDDESMETEQVTHSPMGDLLPILSHPPPREMTPSGHCPLNSIQRGAIDTSRFAFTSLGLMRAALAQHNAVKTSMSSRLLSGAGEDYTEGMMHNHTQPVTSSDLLLNLTESTSIEHCTFSDNAIHFFGVSTQLALDEACMEPEAEVEDEVTMAIDAMPKYEPAKASQVGTPASAKPGRFISIVDQECSTDSSTVDSPCSISIAFCEDIEKQTAQLFPPSQYDQSDEMIDLFPE